MPPRELLLSLELVDEIDATNKVPGEPETTQVARFIKYRNTSEEDGPIGNEITLDLDHLTIDQLRMICAQAGCKGCTSANKFKCRMALAERRTANCDNCTSHRRSRARYSCNTSSIVPTGIVRGSAIRLHPEEDLILGILEAAQAAMKHTQAESCFVLSAVGSVSSLTLRLANAKELKTWNEPLEIVSLVGTITIVNDKHLHVSVSDRNGHTWGGHLIGGKIHTTLELVLGTIQGVTFQREHDSSTGYKELSVSATK